MPEIIEVDGLRIGMVPWINRSNQREALEFLDTATCPVVFGHFEIIGFEMHHGAECAHGLEASLFSRFSLVCSGHFHKKSTGHNINYLGAPYQMTWADYGSPKGFHIFDTSTMELEFIQNPYEIFQKVTYDDSSYDISYYKDMSFEKYSGSYVKVVVLNKSDPFVFEKFMDGLYKAEPLDIKIVEDHNRDVLEDEEIIDQAEDTITILHKFVDAQSEFLNVKDIDKFKRILSEVYIEAINIESF
jgi:hypothetical protein